MIFNAMSGRFYRGFIKLAKMIEIGTCTTSAGRMIILQASLTRYFFKAKPFLCDKVLFVCHELV